MYAFLFYSICSLAFFKLGKKENSNPMKISSSHWRGEKKRNKQVVNQPCLWSELKDKLDDSSLYRKCMPYITTVPCKVYKVLSLACAALSVKKILSKLPLGKREYFSLEKLRFFAFKK